MSNPIEWPGGPEAMAAPTDPMVTAGLGCLSRAQLPSGEFPTYAGNAVEGFTLDHTNFVTAAIMYCLQFTADPAARRMVATGARFLQGQTLAQEVWRYYLRGDPRHDFMPADLDDTACVSYALALAGQARPRNQSVLTANRNHGGLFYTWLTPRLLPPSLDRNYWRVVAPRWMKPVRSVRYWRGLDGPRNDIDPVVNANVLLYLGDTPATHASSAYLLDLMRRGEDGKSSIWYQSELAFYYAL
jgi:hypothetical protein